MTTHDNAIWRAGDSGPRAGRLPRAERRAQLLAAAREIFVTEGYHAASMDDIAAKAEVSKPVLYQHFPSKLDLYLALLELACDDIAGRVRLALIETDDVETRIRSSVSAFYAFVADESGAYRLVFESDLMSEPLVAHQLNRLVTRMAEGVSAIFTERYGVDDESAYLLAASVVGTAQVSARTWLNSGSRLSVDEAAQLTATLVWQGLQAHLTP